MFAGRSVSGRVNGLGFTRRQPRHPEDLNESEFCNHRVDTVVNAARQAEAADKPRAVALWQEADRHVVDEAPWVPSSAPSVQT